VVAHSFSHPLASTSFWVKISPFFTCSSESSLSERRDSWS
jgi:hypothetical protein